MNKDVTDISTKGNNDFLTFYNMARQVMTDLRHDMKQDMTDLENRVDKKFEALESRVDKKFDAVDKRFDGLESEIGWIKKFMFSTLAGVLATLIGVIASFLVK